MGWLERALENPKAAVEGYRSVIAAVKKSSTPLRDREGLRQLEVINSQLREIYSANPGAISREVVKILERAISEVVLVALEQDIKYLPPQGRERTAKLWDLRAIANTCVRMKLVTDAQVEEIFRVMKVV